MRFLGFCFLALVICPAASAKGRGPQTSALSKTEREVIAFLDTLTEAGLRRDVAALDRLYSDDYFHTNPDGSIMTKEQVMASYRASPTAVIEASRHDEDKVRVRGSVAFVNTRVTIKGRFEGHPYERQYRITYLFEKTRGGWRAVTSHATLILQGSR